MKNLGNLMKQAKEMQAKMAEMQAELENHEVTGVSGAGMVKVTLNCKGEMRKLQVDTSLVDPEDKEDLQAAMEELQALLDCRDIMVTLSEHGVAYLNEGKLHHLPAHKRDIADVSGAGDTVVSVAALALSAGAQAEAIAALSNLAGGLVCEELGVVPVDKNALLQEAIRLYP